MRKGGTLVGTARTTGVASRYGSFRPNTFGGTVRRRPAHPASCRQGGHRCRAAEISRRNAAGGSHAPDPDGRQFGRGVGDADSGGHGQVLKQKSHLYFSQMFTCPNVNMPKCPLVQMLSCTNVSLSKCPNVVIVDGWL